MNPFILALKNRLKDGEITQEQYDKFAEMFKEPEKEDLEEVTPAPTLKERVDTLENTILQLLSM